VIKFSAGFNESLERGLELVLVGIIAILAVWIVFGLFLGIFLTRTRKISRRLGRPAFMGVTAPDTNLRQLIPSEFRHKVHIPFYWTVSSTEATVDFWASPASQMPVATIPRDRIVSVSIGTLSGGPFIIRAIDIQVDWLEQPIKMALFSPAWFALGTQKRKKLIATAESLGLTIGNEQTSHP
jgi:hypothetical protein